jgi:hypothetical protein
MAKRVTKLEVRVAEVEPGQPPLTGTTAHLGHKAAAVAKDRPFFNTRWRVYLLVVVEVVLEVVLPSGMQGPATALAAQR